MEAKLNYIRAWQALPEHGNTYFIVKMKGAKKEVGRCARQELYTYLASLYLSENSRPHVDFVIPLCTCV